MTGEEGRLDRLVSEAHLPVELPLITSELIRGDLVHRVVTTPASWASSAPWVVVIAIIVIVVSLRPDPATIGSCLLLLAGAGKAYRGFSQ